jgi:hypothetical protein
VDSASLVCTDVVVGASYPVVNSTSPCRDRFFYTTTQLWCVDGRRQTFPPLWCCLHQVFCSDGFLEKRARTPSRSEVTSLAKNRSQTTDTTSRRQAHSPFCSDRSEDAEVLVACSSVLPAVARSAIATSVACDRILSHHKEPM